MIEWKPLFNEMLSKIRNQEWDIGEVVEVLKQWIDLSETQDDDLRQLSETYVKFQRSEDDEETEKLYEDFIRVCEKTLT